MTVVYPLKGKESTHTNIFPEEKTELQRQQKMIIKVVQTIFPLLISVNHFALGTLSLVC